jgi:hypothetical protein
MFVYLQICYTSLYIRTLDTKYVIVPKSNPLINNEWIKKIHEKQRIKSRVSSEGTIFIRS